MKTQLAKLIQQAVLNLIEKGTIPKIDVPEPQVSVPKERKFGDFATNVAMPLSKKAGMAPRDLAAKIIEALGDGDGLITKCEIAGPGFINLYINQGGMFQVVEQALEQKKKFGQTDFGKGKKVQVEFVSANPTGPLHVGHGRGAVFGDTLARIMAAAGYDVKKEYYVNDAGVQIQTLGRSTYIRYRQLFGDEVEIPEGHYVGDYLIGVAEKLRAEKGDDLTEDDIPDIAEFAAKEILDSIKRDLSEIRVSFDNWFSERILHNTNKIADTLQWLRDKGLGYDKDGAFWFATEQFGDDKDRVLVKSDGQKTYFAADVAYHADKYERGFDLAINVWGADHHGYIPRMKAAAQALGRSADDLEVLLIQLVTLTRSGQVQQMSTRSGQFVTLEELAKEVGPDALRYFFLMRRNDAQLEFDVDLAMEQSNKNPVFYVQYMYARICSIFKKAEAEKVPIPKLGEGDLSLLTLVEEKELARHLADFPSMVTGAAQNREPHRMIGYLYELANKFHYYYHHHRVITEDANLTAARLLLCAAARQVVKNGFALVGISAPESM